MVLASIRFGLLAIVCFGWAVTLAADELPLRHRVDACIDQAAVGPLWPAASDEDWMRRAYLDLTGMIPEADEARAFLADASPDKRERLIDQLLASPRYARHMALLFDVMFVERGPDKAIPTPAWQEYLQKSFAENKPLDQLCREIVTTDGTDPALRPAARFMLDRDCEPNAVARDTGRLLFGMDMQCAQCHDHPSVDDYLQEDYYGLFAFFVRSGSFNDAKQKLLLVAEKADGEANFKSVFTGNAADRVTPRLPKGAAMAAEPTFAKGEEYVVAPAKDVRPVPKFSRRAKLGELLAASPEFRRNLANRLWAQLFGRGLVHPVDFHHSDNPPSHPELLELLGAELARANFDAKAILRELMLTRVYARSGDASLVTASALPPAAETLASLENRRAEMATQLEAARAAAYKAKTDLQTAREQLKTLQTQIAALDANAKTAQAAADKAAAEAKHTQDALNSLSEKVLAVNAAAAKTQEAVAKLPEDKVLAQAAATIAERAKALQAEIEAAAKRAATALSQSQLLTQQANTAKEQLTKASQDLVAQDNRTALEEAAQQADRHSLAKRYEVAAVERQIEVGKALMDYQEKAKADPQAATQAWEKLLEHWAVAGQIAPLRPLTCEQFALSLMQATGVVRQRHAVAVEEMAKKPPPAVQAAPEAERAKVLALLTEQHAFEQLRGHLKTFVGLYGTQATTDFQATVNQALFVENGSVIQGWLQPSGENLTARLQKIDDAERLADELYLALLTRMPAPEERRAVSEYLQDRTADRPAALGELIWALATSNEFRFNH